MVVEVLLNDLSYVKPHVKKPHVNYRTVLAIQQQSELMFQR